MNITIPGVIWEYHPEITALRADVTLPASAVLLSQLTTTDKAVLSRVEIAIVPLGGTERQMQIYQLESGPADATDPGDVAPLDYDAVSNNKHWERVR